MTDTNQLTRLQLNKILVRKSATIIEAMKAIENGTARIALITDAEEKLKGVLTDGDLRRAILNGASLDDPIGPFISGLPRWVDESTSRTEALDLMKCFSIEQLPILDKTGRVRGLHLLNRLIKPIALSNAALVLAGGKGTRLGSLTKSTPKPMIKVAGRPILERIVLHLIGGGIHNIFLSVNYLADVITEHFGDGEKLGCKINYLYDEQPLGTGGPLSLLQDHDITEPVIVMNGDLITDFDIAGIIRSHESEGNAITIGVRTYSHEVPFGCLETVDDRVVSLSEKPIYRATISAGIYVVDPVVIANVPKKFLPITQLIEMAIQQNQKVGIFQVNEWIDVGQPEQLAEARGQIS